MSSERQKEPLSWDAQEQRRVVLIIPILCIIFSPPLLFIFWSIFDIPVNDAIRLSAFTYIVAVILSVVACIWANQRIKHNNQIDWDRACQILGIFHSLSQQDPRVAEVEFSNSGQDWYPVKAITSTVNDIRMAIEGELQLAGFLVYKGTFKGEGKGASQPMLDDLPVVVWLENSQREVMRLIIPSTHMILQMITDFLKSYMPKVPRGSHVWTLLSPEHNTALLRIIDWRKLTPAKGIVDQLIIACDKPAEEKPSVRVKGRSFGSGIVVTAISINDESEQIVLSSALLDQLSGVCGVLGAPESLLLPAA